MIEETNNLPSQDVANSERSGDRRPSPCASLADIRAAKKQRLNEGLSTLARWCDARVLGDHEDETTLTMLEKKATALRGRVISAGWVEIERRNGGWHLTDGVEWGKNGTAARHNDQCLATARSGLNPTGDVIAVAGTDLVGPGVDAGNSPNQPEAP